MAGTFTPWVEKELGCSRKYATELLAVAELPSPDDGERRLQASFQNMDVHELAAAGRAVANLPNPDEVKRGVHASFDNLNVDELAAAHCKHRRGMGCFLFTKAEGESMFIHSFNGKLKWRTVLTTGPTVTEMIAAIQAAIGKEQYRLLLDAKRRPDGHTITKSMRQCIDEMYGELK